MLPVLIGLSVGLLLIVSFTFLKTFDKAIIYGLALAAIGFLYVGFCWESFSSLVITCLQAVFFLFLAYFGIRKNIGILALGYFLHGLWDLVYPFFQHATDHIPPHYDLFCMSIDFMIGAYLLAYIFYQNIRAVMCQTLRSIQ